MQLISNDRTVRNTTVQVLKNFNSRSSATQAKKGKQLTSLMPDIRKAFDFLGNDMVDLPTRNESLKNETASHDGKCSEESKAKLLKQFDDEKGAKWIVSRLEKQFKKETKKQTLQSIFLGSVFDLIGYDK